METYIYPHFPPEISTAYVAFFTGVSNAAELRLRLISAASMAGAEGELERENVNFAFIDARKVCSTLQLRTAIYHAVLAQVQGTLRTKTIHSEILWILNPSNNISEAIKRYGVSDSTGAILVVRIASPGLLDPQAKMSRVVSGKLEPISKLETVTDWVTIAKHYKINSKQAAEASSGDLKEREKMSEVVVSVVATKNIA